MGTHFSENGRVTVCGFATSTLEGDWSDKKEDATCERCKFYIAQRAELDAKLKAEAKANGATQNQG
jgi:hypothetical protein